MQPAIMQLAIVFALFLIIIGIAVWAITMAVKAIRKNTVQKAHLRELQIKKLEQELKGK